MSLQTVFQQFQHPGAAFRGKPFWAWNGKLDPAELRRQIRVMHRMGLGGFFMHARVGLGTAYLSEEWFECVEACIDEAGSLGMEAWLYDEDRWPSGAAGGLVTDNPEYRMRSLEMERLDAPPSRRDAPLALYRARLSGDRLVSCARIPAGARPRLRPGECFLAFRVRVEEPSSWFNGRTYLDTLNPEAVAEFIRLTHERYRERFAARFGNTVPGIFSDEPHHGGAFNWGRPGGVPWTARLPEHFREACGYDLLDHLPELFLDLADRPVSPTRYHFHDCVTTLFVSAFARQIGAWCAKNNLQFTGHVLEEHSLSSQTAMVGGAMRFYEHMQAPGMDLLTEHQREYDTAKGVSSAARQFGRKWRLTETYGCTGWDFPFLGHKALGDWQAALGINLRCQHLFWYTMRGQAKRDYPAAISGQSPWWETYPVVEDYFARVHSALSHGTEVRDLAVLHPNESMWLHIRPGWRETEAVQQYDRALMDLRDSLLEAHLDFDYFDEEILARHGRVRRVQGEPVLVVGKAVYKAVLLPRLLTIRSTTLALLRKFRAAGGTVAFAGAPPEHVDALPSKEALVFARACLAVPETGPEVAAALEADCRRVSIRDEQGRPVAQALHLLREDDQAFYLFVCNTGHGAGEAQGFHDPSFCRDRRAAFPAVSIHGFAECIGSPVELDPSTGQVWAADATRSADGWEIRTSLPALGSRLFVVPKQKSATAAPHRLRLRDRAKRRLGSARWDALLSEDNVLVLDRPAYRIGKGKWNGAADILRIDAAVRKSLGVKPRGGAMVQPWARTPNPAPRRTPVALRYSFLADAVPSGALCLALEGPASFQIQLNGSAVSTDAACGWWTDASLEKVPLPPALLRAGENELTLACDYDEDHAGLEIVYLLGNFGVVLEDGARPRLAAPVTQLRTNDWCAQGLPFYAGSVCYRKSCAPLPAAASGTPPSRWFVRLPEYRGVAVRVLVNGRPAGTVAWEPQEVDITDFAGTGEWELSLEVIGHRRNSHGPHHHRDLWPNWTGPEEFQTEGERWTDRYQLVPCGLLGEPILVERVPE